MKKITLLLIAIILSSCGQSQQKVSPTATLLSNVHIVDVTNGKLIENQHIVIDSAKIQAILTEVTNANQYQNVIDGKNGYLIPGLAEMHAHIPPPTVSKERLEEVLFLYLSNGITTIRGMLGNETHLTLRENIANGKVLGPRVFTSSPSLNGNSVKTKAEAIAKVTAYQKAGFDFLKIHPGIQRDVFDQVVTTGNEVGIPFAGHVPVDVGIRHALESNYASIDHIDGFLEGLVPESENVDPTTNGFFGYNFTPLADIGKIDELVSLSKEHKVWIVPTQSLFERWFAPITADELLQQPEMKYMPKATLENWKQVKERYMADNSFSTAQWQQFDSIRKSLLAALSKNGHGILLGSDAPQLFNVPGFSIHHEIDGMLGAGMTQLEILQSGTTNPAIFFGMEDTFGQVKEGLVADMVVLEANPLENLKALKQIQGVMLKGKWISKTEIEERLAKIAENASK
ncbi:amidohydrolase family protein [Croceitalea sp. MTPC9]|uniref:amidohydrolase family protein n=1 Tax=unclassified Croceitalea TaxID=2632280 RepID=UPI002B381D4E|nr:amidohydrolase family protein [Croceitalea sp. MTPC6]GMN15356.1 amidohydrolase family protein [Croceitalea sp. MTPC9]